ncbi:MAG: DUF342 domain-containing protein [Candidatus Magnetomorum sp.]|nr:DUF342 domain-containing protein [Candidatus Magnetomorum sp.]
MSNVKATKCPKCQQSYRIPETKEGKTATCKKCGQKFKIQFESDSPTKKEPIKAAPKEPLKKTKPIEKPGTQELPESSEPEESKATTNDESSSTDAVVDASTTDVDAATNDAEEAPAEESPAAETPPPPEAPPEPPQEKKTMLEYDRSYRPLDPDTLMESLDIVVSEDSLDAHLVVKKPLERDTTYKDIHYFLAEKKIIFGVVSEDKIKNYLKKKLLHNRPWKIAEGKTPVEPQHGEVNYLFDVDPLKRIPVEEEGDSKERIDFKDRGEMPYVVKGDLIAERTPGIPGVQGMDVYGKQIKPKKAKQATLRCGEGVEQSYDKRLANAKINGMPMLLVERNQEKVIVVPEYFIKGGVNLKTGNVKFRGPVVVDGTVESGFKVNCATLTAKEIMKASLDVDGDIIVGGGVIGTKIQCKGKLEAKFIKGATIDCFSNVSAPGGIIDSKINTSGECIVEKGKILNSEVCAYQGIRTRDIGSHTSPESTLTIGIDPSLLKQAKLYEAEIAAKKKDLEKAKEENKPKDDVIARLEQVIAKIDPLQVSVEKTEALRPALAQKLEAVKKKGDKKELKKTIVMIKEIESKFQAAKENLANLKKERETLEKDMGVLPQIEAEIAEVQKKLDEVNEHILSDRQIAPIKVTGNVYRGTLIIGVHTKHEMKDDENKVVIQEIYKVDEEDKVESVIISEPLKSKEK